VLGPWGTIANDPQHPSRYISDSPAGVYPSNNNGVLTLVAPLDLSHGVHAWAFYDESKNRSRRWCSAAECGNLIKVRRFRERQRAARPAPRRT